MGIQRSGTWARIKEVFLEELISRLTAQVSEVKRPAKKQGDQFW